MKIFTLMAGALALIAGGAAAENRLGSVVHVTEADDGHAIRVPVGLEIRARIAQPSGTPDRWEMRNDPHVSLIETPQSQVAYGTGMGRGREFRLFRIRVDRPGRFPLIFGLLPPRSNVNQVPTQRIVMNIDAPPSGRDERWRPNPDYGPYDGDGPDTVEPLNERDAYRQIDVPIGQEMTIALPSNISTGYHWDAVSMNNVRILGDIEEERARDARIGGGGTALVRFRVQQRGRAEVTLMYLPPGGGTARRTLIYRFRGI